MGFLDLLELVFRRRRFIIVNTLAATLLAVVVVLVIPRTYRARATILPPESESPLGALSGLSAGHIAQAVMNFSLPLMASPSDLYASMLKSETVLGRVVDSLDLAEVYESETKWQAVATLRDNLQVVVERDGIVKIEADARTPRLAAGIANLLVATLDDLNRSLQRQKGRDYSSFLELRLRETDSSLAASSEDLKRFQEQHRAISLELQSEALINNLATQKAALTSAEIDLELSKKSLYPNHPDLVRKQMVVNEFRNKLRDIEVGAVNVVESTLSALDIPLSRVPDLSLQFAVLKRNVKIQELTYELLSQQLEMARIQERRDTPTLMVLDIARPPEKAVKPKRRTAVTAVFLLSLAASSVIAILGERARSENLRATSEHLRGLWQQFRRHPLG